MSTERDEDRSEDETEQSDYNGEEQHENESENRESQGDDDSEAGDNEEDGEKEDGDNKEDDQQAEWSFVRPQCQRKLPAVNVYYRVRTLEQIEVRLNEVSAEILERFRTGCCGHFLNWKGGRGGSGRALYALVSRQIIIPDRPKHELWFRVCGYHLKFSMPEFALMTGLKFGPSEFDTTAKYDASDSALVQRFCGGNPNVTLNELLNLFLLSGNKKVSQVDEDYLKVANVLIIFIFGLGHSMTKLMEDWAWKLVEDLDAWNNFPWGGYCYKQLLYYFDHLPSNGVEVGVSIHFMGAVHALQIWSYEAIPALGRCVAKVVDDGEQTPRLLRWKFSKSKIEEFDDFYDKGIMYLTLPISLFGLCA